MSTLLHRRERETWVAPKSLDMASSVAPASDDIDCFLDLEDWERMDRPLRFPAERTTPQLKAGGTHDVNPARARWLEEHDVRTEFLDGGIGCCWFAQQGEQEPSSGETEDEAIEHLARERGLELWAPQG